MSAMGEEVLAWDWLQYITTSKFSPVCVFVSVCVCVCTASVLNLTGEEI